MNRRDDLQYNGSGVKDPTAYKAIKNVNKGTNRVRQLITVIHSIAHLSGFEIIGRIELRDKKTGEVWR